MEFRPLEWRSIQIGLSGEAVKNELLNGWILRIEDLTETATEIGELVELGQLAAAEALSPSERRYVFLEDSVRIACHADLKSVFIPPTPIRFSILHSKRSLSREDSEQQLSSRNIGGTK